MRPSGAITRERVCELEVDSTCTPGCSALDRANHPHATRISTGDNALDCRPFDEAVGKEFPFKLPAFKQLSEVLWRTSGAIADRSFAYHSQSRHSPNERFSSSFPLRHILRCRRKDRMVPIPPSRCTDRNPHLKFPAQHLLQSDALLARARLVLHRRDRMGSE